MTPERWKKLDALFHEALALQGEARAAHLAKVCDNDEQLRAEVERLIAAHEREGSFIDSPIFAAELSVDDLRESLAGRSIGHYNIVSLLGRGGMGEVYLALDIRLERKVALKVLPAAFTQNPERVRRFEREAKAASALNHPNILTIHEIGRVDGANYIVSEFVEGETLRALINRGKLDISQALAITEQVASALGVAHHAGIIHRDIKPENVMVRPDGLVKVLDFGLAKLTERQRAGETERGKSTIPPSLHLSVSTESGMVMGTVSYMSPEQARGQKVDHRTDIFSLGAMLYEMIAGRRPFEGATTSDVIAALLTTEPPTLKSLTPQAPTGLEGIIKKCLAKGREARYQSATELAAELKAVQAGSHAAAAVLHRKLGRALSFLALPRYSSAGILGACMLLLFGGALGWREFSKFRNAADESRRIVPAIQLRRFTASGNIVAATLSPDGKYVATALEEGGLQSLWLKQVAANASGVRLIAPALVEYWGVTFSQDGNFIYYLAWVRNQSDAELYRLPVLGGTPHRLPIKQLDTPISLSPDGGRFAYVTPSARRRESYVKVARLDDEVGETLVTRSGSGFIAVYPGGPAWSPNGQFIAYAATGWNEGDRRPMRVFAVNVADKMERQVGQRSWAEIGRVAWLNDGSGLVFSAREDLAGPRQLWFVAWPNGAARKLTNDLHDYDGVSLSADGQTLVAVQRQEAFSIAVAPQSSPSQASEIYSEVSPGHERIAWTPDQHLLYSSRISGNWDIWLMNKEGSGQRQLTFDPGEDTLPAVSADGRYVYYASDRAGTANIWRTEINSGEATRLTSGKDEFFPEVTPDGQWLMYQQGLGHVQIGVWRVALAGGQPARVHEQTMVVSITKRPAVSPDGQWLAYVSLDERGWGVTLRALGGGGDKRFSFPPIIGRHEVRWTPNSKALAYIVQENGVANLWLQPLNGVPPKPLTHFKTGRFTAFAWSPDGQWLAYLRPTAMSDVVLLRDFK